MEDMKFYEEYDGDTKIIESIETYIEEHGGLYDLESITIGYWEDAYEGGPRDVIEYIVNNKDKFPNLKTFYLGDMDSEECEISWIMHDNAAPLINELKLEELTIQGSSGLRLENAKSDTLKKLTIICGGIPKEVLGDILDAELPNLEHLELYIGIDNYGFDGDITTLEPFMQRSNFPKLKYLGLKNSDIQNKICKKVIDSDIIKDLEVLDLSLGTLGDTGAKKILENIDKLSHLKKLDLTYNYISDELLKNLEDAFSKTGVELLTSQEDVYDDDDDYDDDYDVEENDPEYDEDDKFYRYPYITE